MRSRSLAALGLLALGLLCARTADAAVVANGDRCGNQDTCESGYACFFNKCVVDTFEGVNGQGNECSAQDCCPGDLKCYDVGSSLNVNTGSIPGLPDTVEIPVPTGDRPSVICLQVTAQEAVTEPEVQCAAQQPGQGGSQDPNTPVQPAPDQSTDGSCGNAAPCPNGDYCLANRCVDAPVAGVGAINALGNTCSATDCCPQGLMCTQDGNRCAPQVSSIGFVTCTATGGMDSGVRVEPQQDGNNNGQEGNSATGHQAASGIVAILLAAGAAAMRAW